MKELIEKYNEGQTLNLGELSSLISHYSSLIELVSKHSEFELVYIKCLRDLEILLKLEKNAI